MKKDLIFEKIDPSEQFKTALGEALRKGVRRLLQQAVENEVQEFLNAFRGVENRRWSAQDHT